MMKKKIKLMSASLILFAQYSTPIIALAEETINTNEISTEDKNDQLEEKADKTTDVSENDEMTESDNTFDNDNLKNSPYADSSEDTISLTSKVSYSNGSTMR